MEALAERLKKLAEAERNYAAELRKLSETLSYLTPLAAIIEAVARDSEKHAELYEALHSIAAGAPQPKLLESDLKALEEAVNRHIETERRMIEESRKLLGSIEEPRMQLLIAAIYEDELRHHKLLTDIKDKLAKARVLTEEQFWEAVWRDSPFHGAPGG
ncbi:MAG: hypothetical protein QXT33_07350 [Thermofilum sp.]